MKLFNFFCSNKKTSPAAVAKQRLQIIVSHESTRNSPDIIKQLQEELMAVLSKYIKVDQNLIKVHVERNGDQSVLELNVTFPEGSTLAAPAEA